MQNLAFGGTPLFVVILPIPIGITGVSLCMYVCGMLNGTDGENLQLRVERQARADGGGRGRREAPRHVRERRAGPAAPAQRGHAAAGALLREEGHGRPALRGLPALHGEPADGGLGARVPRVL